MWLHLAETTFTRSLSSALSYPLAPYSRDWGWGKESGISPGAEILAHTTKIYFEYGALELNTQVQVLDMETKTDICSCLSAINMLSMCWSIYDHCS
jgi:hypothetical protein